MMEEVLGLGWSAQEVAHSLRQASLPGPRNDSSGASQCQLGKEERAPSQGAPVGASAHSLAQAQ